MAEWDWILEDTSMEAVRRLNDVCENIKDAFETEGGPLVPPVFIVGPPRSGTTLLYQLIAFHLDVAYVNNFLARFWNAPAIGAHLSANVIGIEPQEDVISSLGSTDGLGGVHEFGYFWKRFFHGPTDFEESISPEHAATMLREVGTMSRILGKRLVFKNLACGLRLGPLAQVFGKPLIIEIRRSPLANAMAILEGRKQYHGDEQTWWSLEPKNLEELKSLPVSAQIDSQIQGLREAVSERVEAADVQHLVVEYEALCREPQITLEAVADFIGVSQAKPCVVPLAPRFAPEALTELEKELYEYFGPDAR